MHRLIRGAVWALVAALTAAPGAALQEDAGFTPLFNGRDLRGWVNVNCAPETWSVREGMIHSTGKPICELRTDRMYENFVLELEYKHLEPGGNAGVFVWGDALTARGQPFVRAIEIQVLDGRNTDNYTSHGDVFAIHGARLTPDRPHPGGWMRSLPIERRARPAGEWNQYRITAQNGTIKLAVNGRDVSGGYDISPRKGYIHLESEGGVVQWRNLRIKELPGAATLAPDQIAQADEGFVSLYTGTDFRGWEHAGPHEGHWISKDWVIVSDGKAEGAGRELRTQKAFGDAAVIADWRRTGGAGGDELPLGFGGVELPADAVARVNQALSRLKPDDWRRAILTRRGGRVTLTINGESVLKDVAIANAPARSALALRSGARPAELASIFVREF